MIHLKPNTLHKLTVVLQIDQSEVAGPSVCPWVLVHGVYFPGGCNLFSMGAAGAQCKAEA